MVNLGRWRAPLRGLALCAALLAALASTALSQTDAARLVGNVTDPTGAALTGATVTVTDLSTNRTVTTRSDDSGAYTVTALPPGRYRIEVTQSGFKIVRQEVTLQVQQVATIDFKLEPGGASEVVDVH